MGATQSIEDIIFNLRLTNKQLQKLSTKAQAEEKKEKAKVTKAIRDRDLERGRVFAENAIRKKNESLNYLRLAARLDAVVSRLQSAQAMRTVSAQMGSVVKGLDKVMETMDLVQLSSMMDKFETQFGNLDVHTSVMEKSMAGAMSTTTPADQVEALMREVAEEHELDKQADLSAVRTPHGELPEVEQLSSAEDADLQRRLAALRS